MNHDLSLPVTIAGIPFKNPFYVASGPTARTVEQLLAIEKAGWAAASIKLSIDPAPYINRYPRYKVFPQYNALAFTAEKRLRAEEGIQLVKQAKAKLTDLVLLANITYAGDSGLEGWVRLAERFAEAGADIIELNMCCPNMSFNVETSGNTEQGATRTGASLGKQADVVAEVVSAIKRQVGIPLFVKLTPEGGEIASVAQAVWHAGADAVGGTGNRLGMPPIDLDAPEKAAYHLQKEISMSCYCGSWLKPLAQRDTYEMRKLCGPEMPIMATGGIRTAEDGLEMAMCGADLLGICTETLMRGYSFIGPEILKMKDWLRERGHPSLRSLRDKVVTEVKSAPELTLYKGWAQVREAGLSAPCAVACPQKIPVQAALKYVSEGRFAHAYTLIAGSEACASCAAPCEKACVKGRVAQGLSIRALFAYLRQRAAASGVEIGKKTLDSQGAQVVAKAKQVLENRVIHGAEQVNRVINSDETAAQEASRCLRCGCGEGCALCIEICCEFAISMATNGTISIDKSKCVACGMCYNRCPNGNIYMHSTGETL